MYHNMIDCIELDLFYIDLYIVLYYIVLYTFCYCMIKLYIGCYLLSNMGTPGPKYSSLNVTVLEDSVLEVRRTPAQSR